MRHSYAVMVSLFVAPTLAVAQMSPRDRNAAKATAESPPATALPAWLSVGGQVRARAEAYHNGGFRPDNSDQYILTRALLNARVRPTRNTSLFVEGMDARGPWKNKTPTGAPFRDHADLRQLYLQIGEDNRAQLLRAGRLELAFGDGRLVGSLPWAYTARTFDGARGTLGGTGYRVDAFATSVVKVEQDKFDKNVPGNNFYGVYSSITKLAPRAAVEPFLFWRRQSGLTSEAGVRGTMNFGTLGLRALGKLPSNFDYDVQMASQNGKLGDESIRAWAGHWLLGFTLATAPLTPRVFGEYNEASGDENPTDNKKGTFDQLYPTGHDKLGLSDQVGWKNIHDIRTGLEYKWTSKLTLTGFYHNWWLASARDALYAANGTAVVKVAAGTAGRHVGQEADVQMTYALNAVTSIGAGYANVFPGEFLKKATPGKQYRLPYVMLTYSF